MLASVDIGQSVAVSEKACVAVEAMEGTDSMLRRAASLANGKPLRLIKASRGRAHLLFDVPVTGVTTIETMIETQTTALAVDAGCTLLLDREEMLDSGKRRRHRNRRPPAYMTALRVAVIGAGAFGRHHVRAIKQLQQSDLVAIVDLDRDRAQQLANEYGSRAFGTSEEVLPEIDAAILATPTVTHEEIATKLLHAGVDVLVEKPIADSSAAGERLAHLAEQNGRVLQVGHLERFNPAVVALEQALTTPLFFEVHRLSTFTPRSLDIDVVLDLMIHDLDIVLNFTREAPQEIRAAGISVLSPRVDIANVRLSFASGCVANLTASRISTEKIRKSPAVSTRRVHITRLPTAGRHSSSNSQKRTQSERGGFRFAKCPIRLPTSPRPTRRTAATGTRLVFCRRAGSLASPSGWLSSGPYSLRGRGDSC